MNRSRILRYLLVVSLAIASGVASFSKTAATRPKFQLQAISPQFWDLMDRDTKMTVVATGFKFTEGPVWDSAGYLYFSDEAATAQQRLALNAYLLAGITEYWRAYRNYAGVLHFAYLTSSDPAGYTSDHFRDLQNLELHSDFRDYMSNAFAPVGVYLSYWQPTSEAGSLVSLLELALED